jgi:DNA topoisomerase-2
MKFIKLVLDKKIIINNRSKDDVIKQIKSYKLAPKDDDLDGYGYLIKLPLYNLTKEKVEELMNECKNKKLIFETLKKKTPKELWLEDIEQFIIEYRKFNLEYKKKY